MVALNFQPEFAPLILTGQKIQTIRQTLRAMPGQKLQLYVGMRTPNCTKIMDTVCSAISQCIITPNGVNLDRFNSFSHDPDEFARADGFKDFNALLTWFQKRYGPYDFVGYVHGWDHHAALQHIQQEHKA